MNYAAEIKVRVCEASKPRETKNGKTLTTQQVVIEQGEAAPLVVERKYWDVKHILPAGYYMAQVKLYSYMQKNEAGYPEQRLGAALGGFKAV